ncbi:MAG: Hsp20/alpha crystallin family protein [Lachnospiraceae bacterium]|nr:Hsp20/alpha crystallin family protein [Lachnospiraceae bacterium]
MYLPNVFGENLLDDMFSGFDRSFPFERNYKSGQDTFPSQLMKTDIKETDKAYEMEIDLPGYAKENVSAELKNGYLTISASKEENKDEKDDNGKYIRRERYSGSCKRSFFVGEDVKQTDINASFKDGILNITVPKIEVVKGANNGTILIEG